MLASINVDALADWKYDDLNWTFPLGVKVSHFIGFMRTICPSVVHINHLGVQHPIFLLMMAKNTSLLMLKPSRS